jgi:carbonic anhydrase
VHLARTTIMQEAWRRGQSVTLHGLVYGLKDGLLHDLGIAADSVAGVNARYEKVLAARAALSR